MKAVWYALTSEMLNEFLTTDEAAQFLKMKKPTLEQMRLNGDGPTFRRLGKKIIRYQVDDLVSWCKPHNSTAEYEKAA